MAITGELLASHPVQFPSVGTRTVGAGSVSWKIHSEVVLLLGWGRALLLLLSHPLIARGVADHSSFLIQSQGRLRRLYRTLDAMLSLTFGPDEQAEQVVRRINAIHDRVHGQLQETTGDLSAGTRYSAHDPALLCWVHATLLDSFLLTYESYVGLLSPEEKDRYCAEASSIEPLLGIPAGSLPRNVTELHGYMERMLASGEITVTETTRALARAVAFIDIPRVFQPLFWLVQLPTVGYLPPLIREEYRFPWGRHREGALRLSSRLIRALLPLAPSILRHWPKARAAIHQAEAKKGQVLR